MLGILKIVRTARFLFCVASFVSAQDPFPWATALSNSGWTATADSSHQGNEPSKAIDHNANTTWRSQTQTQSHWLQVDLKHSHVVTGFSYQPRQNVSLAGNIVQHTLSLSSDGTTWTAPVAFGTFLADNTTKYSFFTPVVARYVRLTALSSQMAGDRDTSVAELNIYTPYPAQSPAAFLPSDPSTQGRWGATIDLPVDPAAAFVTADDVVVMFSAFRPDDNWDTVKDDGGTGQTYTTLWRPGSSDVSQRIVSNTRHDMFCPGLSMDVNGLVVVSGGNDENLTSIYDPATHNWRSGAHLNIPRGYHSSVTIGDGRIFTIGGSFSGALGGKNGEIYDSTADSWTNLPGAAVEPMLTKDHEGIYRQDNHAWLFAWRNNSVFQAGPSSAMNWYNVSGAGSLTSAGNRASDPDSMCGTAVMYDAVAGLVLTAGGSPSYENSSATANAHILKLGEANSLPAVTRIADMRYPRSFANSVVLPDGKVLVIGGQPYPVTFTDTNATLPGELLNPSTQSWTQVAPVAEARTYHSVALLLPDATVLAGGGGLCGIGCLQNHFTAQVWSPPYLFNPDGSAARRPVIQDCTPGLLKPGARFTIHMARAYGASEGDFTFALIRYGTSTHTVNTDQRRIPLKATAKRGPGLEYSLILPVDPGVLVPGVYMLFAMNRAGVPSISKQLKIQAL